jgi:hypothetical protein
MAELARTVAGSSLLNHRQRALLQPALRHPLESDTNESHAASHQVHYQTARTDWRKRATLKRAVWARGNATFKKLPIAEEAALSKLKSRKAT